MRVLDGTDDNIEETGMIGFKVCYAALKVTGGYEREDGKHFNMTYLPDRIQEEENSAAHVIKLDRRE